MGAIIINLKKTKIQFSFNEFILSLAAEPLEIKYKHMAEIFGVSQSTLSKLLHNKLNRMPVNMNPDVMADRFTEGILGSFAPSCGTIRNFCEYARLLNERYFLSDALTKTAGSFIYLGSVDDIQAKQLYTDILPGFLKSCYKEAYANTEMNFSGAIVVRSEARSEAYFQMVCNTIDRDLFDEEKLKQLLNIVYAANIRHQVTTFFENPSFLTMLEHFMHNQVNKPYYNSIHRSEIISISDDSTQIVRKIKEQKQIVLQANQPHVVFIKQSLNYYMDLAPPEIMEKMFKDFTCTVNRIPLIEYIGMHEKSEYTTLDQFACVEHLRDEVSGTVRTDVFMRFHLYPSTAGEVFTVSYAYDCIAPFIPNISCNYSFCLQYPCRFFEHEVMLDAKTMLKWGISTKLFTPMACSPCFSAEEPGFHSETGSSDSRRITFYDWTLAGSGYCQNLYELQYTNGEIQ